MLASWLNFQEHLPGLVDLVEDPPFFKPALALPSGVFLLTLPSGDTSLKEGSGPRKTPGTSSWKRTLTLGPALLPQETPGTSLNLTENLLLEVWG